MARILSFLLFLMFPAVSFAGAADGLVPAGSLSNALALVEANRISDAIKTLATFRPDMATLGPATISSIVYPTREKVLRMILLEGPAGAAPAAVAQ
jgi:hypothetical protein